MITNMSRRTLTVIDSGEVFDVMTRAHRIYSEDPQEFCLSRYIAAKRAWMIAKKSAQRVINAFTFNVGGMLLEGPELYTTARQLSHLSELESSNNSRNRRESPVFVCTCEDYVSCWEFLDYLISQKRKKLQRNTVGILPYVGSSITVGRALRSAYKRIKGTRGVARREYAREMAGGMMDECPVAELFVAELMGSCLECGSWILMFSIADASPEDALHVLEEKLQSS